MRNPALRLLPVVVLLAACGSDEATEAPAAAPTPTPRVVTLLSETAAGGRASTVATRLDGPEGAAALTGGLGAALAARVETRVARTDVPARQALYGAVVHVGCDVPPGVGVTRRGSRVLVTPRKASAPTQECLAPVTTVAVVLVPDP